MEFLKKGKWLPAVLLVGTLISVAYAATYIQRFTVLGTEVWRINNDGSLVNAAGITSVGPARRGNTATGSGVTLPTTTTGSNFASWVPIYNAGSTALAQGDVIMASNTGTGYGIKGTATSGLTSIIGVAAEAISATTNGWMVPRGGGYAVVKTTGTVNIGDLLVSTISAAGYLTGSTSPTSGTDVGTALSAGTAGGGTILAILH